MSSRGQLISIQCRCHLISNPSKALMILVSVSISYITIYTVKYTHAHFIRYALLVLGWTLQTCFNVIQIQQGAESITQRCLSLIHNLVSDSTTAQRCTEIWWLWKAIHRELISHSSNQFEMIWWFVVCFPAGSNHFQTLMLSLSFSRLSWPCLHP